LKNQILDKKKLLEESLKRKSTFSNITSIDSTTSKAWQRTHKMTVGTRRILVKEITSLFELKPGVIEEREDQQQQQQPQRRGEEDFSPAFSNKSSSFMQEEGKEDLYICGVTLPTRLIDVSSKCNLFIGFGRVLSNNNNIEYPKEELNAPIGLVIHMLGLIVRYLGVKLPFEIIRRGIRPYIRAPNKQHIR
jgi:hypothetical protein